MSSLFEDPRWRDELDLAKTAIRNHQSDVASFIQLMLLAWCEERREWVREAWIQMGSEFNSIEFYVGLLTNDEDEYSSLGDELSALDVDANLKIGELNSPWRIVLNCMSFRFGEELRNFMKFDDQRSSRIFPPARNPT